MLNSILKSRVNAEFLISSTPGNQIDSQPLFFRRHESKAILQLLLQLQKERYPQSFVRADSFHSSLSKMMTWELQARVQKVSSIKLCHHVTYEYIDGSAGLTLPEPGRAVFCKTNSHCEQLNLCADPSLPAEVLSGKGSGKDACVPVVALVFSKTTSGVSFRAIGLSDEGQWQEGSTGEQAHLRLWFHATVDSYWKMFKKLPLGVSFDELHIGGYRSEADRLKSDELKNLLDRFPIPDTDTTNLRQLIRNQFEIFEEIEKWDLPVEVARCGLLHRPLQEARRLKTSEILSWAEAVHQVCDPATRRLIQILNQVPLTQLLRARPQSDGFYLFKTGRHTHLVATVQELASALMVHFAPAKKFRSTWQNKRFFADGFMAMRQPLGERLFQIVRDEFTKDLQISAVKDPQNFQRVLLIDMNSPLTLPLADLLTSQGCRVTVLSKERSEDLMALAAQRSMLQIHSIWQQDTEFLSSSAMAEWQPLDLIVQLGEIAQRETLDPGHLDLTQVSEKLSWQVMAPFHFVQQQMRYCRSERQALPTFISLVSQRVFPNWKSTDRNWTTSVSQAAMTTLVAELSYYFSGVKCLSICPFTHQEESTGSWRSTNLLHRAQRIVFLARNAKLLHSGGVFQLNGHRGDDI